MTPFPLIRHINLHLDVYKHLLFLTILQPRGRLPSKPKGRQRTLDSQQQLRSAKFKCISIVEHLSLSTCTILCIISLMGSLKDFKLFNFYFNHMKKNKSSIIVQDALQPTQKFQSAQSINLSPSKDWKSNSQINAVYAQRFLGEWKEECYSVTRKYISTSSKGISLYITYFTPPRPFATYVILHGYGDHSGRYLHLADEFARNGYQVVVYDQRGFGQSGGIRGTSSIEEMHKDLESVLRTIERSQPIFLYCQSLGAALGMSFCIANPTLNLQGVIVVNPYLQLAKKYGFLKKLLLKLANLVVPDLMINSYMDYSHCSKNNYIIRSVAEDQFIFPIMSIKMAYNFLQLDQFILPNAHKFTQPILILHGKEDKVASHMNSIELYRRIGAKDKTLKLFEKGFHELQNDVEFERLKNVVLSWSQKLILKDKRIAYLRELNHGVSLEDSRGKRFVLQLIMGYILLKKYWQNQPRKVNNLGMMGRSLSLLALIMATFVANMRL